MASHRGLSEHRRDTSVHLTALYQPVVHLKTGQVIAVEALVRIVGSQCSPEEWFQRAELEGTGPVAEVAAARAALRGVRELPAGLPFAVNFSAAALIGTEACGMLLPYAERLVVELTERSRTEDFQALRSALAPLRAAGAQLALDDVGAGYANFQHFSQLRPEILKIDRSVTAGLVTDHVSRAFAAALVDFAAAVGAHVTAEGVETTAEMRAARELGVTSAQGYLLGRPGPPASVRGHATRA